MKKIALVIVLFFVCLSACSCNMDMSNIESKLDSIIEKNNEIDLSKVEKKLDAIIENNKKIDMLNVEKKLDTIIENTTVKVSNKSGFFSHYLDVQYTFSNITMVGDKLYCICYVNVVPVEPNCQFDNASATIKISIRTDSFNSIKWKINTNNNFSYASNYVTINLDKDGFGTTSFCFVNDGDGSHPLLDGTINCSISSVTGNVIIKE